MNQFPNCKIKFSLLIKNYQYIDSLTIIGLIELYSTINSKIYHLRQKQSKNIKTIFVITDSDVWKINSDQINNFNFIKNNKNLIRLEIQLIQIQPSVVQAFFKKNGFKMIFKNAVPIFLSRGTILNYNQGDFVFKNKLLA